MLPLPPLPTTVLAGYLGAGKTTLLNHLLKRSAYGDGGSRRLAVLVNDFGDINIDASLIVDQAENTITLSNGCICCSIGGALYDAIDALLRRSDRPDHLLIEASGVAEPARIANIARAEPDLQLDAIVTLVDAEQFPARLNDPLIAHSVRAQIQQADWLVLTKTDLATDEQQRLTRESIAHLAPHKPIIVAIHGKVDLQLLIGHGDADGHRRSEQVVATDCVANDVQHETQYQRWSIQSNRLLSAKALESLTTDLPASLLRLKGYVGRSDQSQATLLQVVGHRVNVSVASPNSPNHTQLVAIALDANDLVQLEQRVQNLFVQTGMVND